MIRFPPSTVRYAPVTKDAWFEARYAMAAATSSGLPFRRRGVAWVLLQKIWKEGDGREAFFLASFTLPLETSWRYMQLDR